MALERRRTGGDVIVGALLVLAALYVFGNVVLATKLSILVLGWTAPTHRGPERLVP